VLTFRLLPWEYGVRNLLRRPGRSALTLAGLTLVVLLVFVVVGFIRGLEGSLAVSGDAQVVLVPFAGCERKRGELVHPRQHYSFADGEPKRHPPPGWPWRRPDHVRLGRAIPRHPRRPGRRRGCDAGLGPRRHSRHPSGPAQGPDRGRTVARTRRSAGRSLSRGQTGPERRIHGHWSTSDVRGSNLASQRALRRSGVRPGVGAVVPRWRIYNRR